MRRLAVIVGLAAACLLMAGLFVFDGLPFLRGGFGWQWPYVPVETVRPVPLIMTLAVYGIVGVLLLWADRLRGLAVWSVIGCIALTVAVLTVRHADPLHELALRTLSPLTTGWHTAAARIDWGGTGWHDWPTQMMAFEGRIAHANLAPPALPLLYAALADLLDRAPGLASTLGAPVLAEQCHNYEFLVYTPGEWASAWLGILMPVWAGLAALPVIALAQRTAGRPAAGITALLYPLVPALLVFAPTWNTLYPLLSAGTLLLLDIGLRRDRHRALFIACAGLLTGLAVFVNFAFVPLGLLAGVYTLLHWWSVGREQGVSFMRPVVTGIIYGAGVAVVWVIYGAITGIWPPDLLAASLGMHFELNRAYLPWVWLHFWDWALWTGLPVIGLWLMGCAAVLPGVRRRTDGLPVLPLALLITVLILIFSNAARGETGRVWTLFMPFAVIAAAGVLVRFPRPSRSMPRAVIVIVAVQAIWVLALAAVIDAVDVDLRLPPAPPPAHADVQPVEANFGGSFTLTGWRGRIEDETIILDLNWRGEAVMFQPYMLAGLVVDQAGLPASTSVTWQPDATRYPTTCWTPGVTIGETVRIPLNAADETSSSAAASSDAFWISLAAFTDAVGVNRLPVTAAGAVSDQTGLGPVSAATP